ncbi:MULTISPECIES: hypothetical protein [unclassified Mesorhizobium]|uniref:hypothetical protein n=1 Tax=unclassified Mesorhizobium TaxID=325217 RepID=UPI001678B42D|nr:MULTISPECIES: hypothetical protein [unclassified Mesorhizobium]
MTDRRYALARERQDTLDVIGACIRDERVVDVCHAEFLKHSIKADTTGGVNNGDNPTS